MNFEFRKNVQNFLKSEFGLTPLEISNMAKDEVFDLREKCFEIEAFNVPDDDSVSELCETAADAVDDLLAFWKAKQAKADPPQPLPQPHRELQPA